MEQGKRTLACMSDEQVVETGTSKRTMPELPAEMMVEISRHCDASTRRALALTCSDVASLLAHPACVREAKQRLTITKTIMKGKDLKSVEQVLPNGVRHGALKVCRADGTVLTVAEYVDGKRHGKLEEFYLNGKRSLLRFYIDDKAEGKLIEWHPNGRIKAREFLVGGQLHGINKYYDKRGRLCSLQTFHEGKLHGVTKMWKGRKLFCEMPFDNDEWHGLEKYWDSDGNLTQAQNFKHGKAHGRAMSWYPDGRPESASVWVDDKCVKYRAWDQAGQLVSTEVPQDD